MATTDEQASEPSEAVVIEDRTGLLEAGTCYFQDRGQVVTSLVTVIDALTGAEHSLIAVDVPGIAALPEMERNDPSIIVLPMGMCSATVLVRARRGTKRERAAAKLASRGRDAAWPSTPGVSAASVSAAITTNAVLVTGFCADALPVAFAVPAGPTGHHALRKGAGYLLALSVAQLCLLSPVGTPAAIAGIAASAAVLFSADGGTRSARQVRALSTASAILTVLALLVTSAVLASALPSAVRRMARVCDPNHPFSAPSSSSHHPAPPYAAAATPDSRARGQDNYGYDGLWSSAWAFPMALRKSHTSPPPLPDTGAVFVLSAQSDARWLSEEAAGGTAVSEETKGVRNANANGARAPEAETDDREACVRGLRAAFILVGVAFVLVVVGLQLGALLAAALVAREAALLLRHAPLLESDFVAV